MSEEVPKWMKELEEQRERRLKARLGHEAGAGSPCLTCEEKCPGLDLHFWRKICKNCKCGKENHNVNDDDVYGWAEFQLLGSKPNKRKKFVIPGQKDAVELDWIPKGVADAVETYLKDLPLNLLPIKGSPAALERKQLLQKQIPLHDIDPSLCHALSEKEIQQMNDYITHIKQDSVGVGRILKLNELLVANHAPIQVPQMENIVLQGANRADLLQKNLSELKLEDKLPVFLPNTLCNNENDYQNPAALKAIQDLRYLPNFAGVPHNQEIDYQNPQVGNHIRNIYYPASNECERGANNNVLPVKNQASSNVEYATLSNSSNLQIPNVISNTIDTQSPVNPGGLKDVNYLPSGLNGNVTCGLNINDLQIPRNVYNCIDYQSPAFPGTIHDLRYPFGSSTTNESRICKNHTIQNCTSCTDNQSPVNTGIIRDLRYPFGNPTTNENPTCENHKMQNCVACTDSQSPVNTGIIRDLRYHPFGNPTTNENPTCENHKMQNCVACTDNQSPVNTGTIRDLRYPFGNSKTNQNPTCINHKIQNCTACTVYNYIDNQSPVDPGTIRDLSYPFGNPTTHENSICKNHNIQNCTACTEELKGTAAHPYNYANIKDLAYSTYNPQPSNTPDETNLTPTPVSIGLIKDIEYPNAPKSEVLFQNVTEPALPRKNVHFNLVPEEILPSCHKCRKVFDATALVIGVNHTDALWHADCFKCAGCNQNLADLMYFYDKDSDDVYCGRDYAKIRGIPRCQACDELIFVKEYCLAENSTFHVKHFCCFECDVPLAGQNYVMEESQPLCLPCYELLKAEKCNTCLRVIKPDEQGANLKDVHFHADDKCFVCKMCTKPLLGAKFLFKNMNLYCSAPCFGADK